MFVEDHAPTGWWTSISDLYQKALDFEVNGLSSGRTRDRSPERVDRYFAGRSTDHSRERRSAGQKKRKGGPEGGVRSGPSKKGGGFGHVGAWAGVSGYDSHSGSRLTDSVSDSGSESDYGFGQHNVDLLEHDNSQGVLKRRVALVAPV